MATLPTEVSKSVTVQAIYANYEARRDQRRSRRLGASQIGKPCERQLWYDFRWAGVQEFDGRMIRLFETGTMEEHRFIANLRHIGCTAEYPFEGNEDRFTFTSVSGHFVCKIDAVVLGLPEAPKTWHVCEFKTHAAKSFRELEKHGLAKAKPEHLAQIQMGMDGPGLDRALYLAVNKDTDEMYSHRVERDDALIGSLKAKAERIITSPTPPAKIADSASKFPCTFCSHKQRCHGDRVSDVTCRSCVHSTPIMDGDYGLWRCERKQRMISDREQEAACEEHLFIPDLVPFADAVDSFDENGIGWIKYKNKIGGQVWTQGRAEGQYRSVELAQLTPEMLGDEYIQAAKGIGCVATEVSP